jgi:peptide/nickel transport system substrate-binding protein
VATSGLQHDFFGPKHYLEQFHEKFANPEELKKDIQDAGFVTWVDFFMQRMDQDRNPDLPSVGPFVIKVPYPNSRCVAERNPYYYKVDTEGNQLPYMDRMVTTMVFDNTILNLKAMNGEADFQIRKIDASNFTLFKEKGRQSGYRTLVTPSTNPMCIYVNQYSRDDATRAILQDRRFRLALSYAINRKELIDLIFTGLAAPSSGFTIPDDPYYFDDLEHRNIEYNPAKANALLDEIGLKRRKTDGLRLLPNGKLFTEVLHIYPSEEGTSADLWQLVVDYWREVGLHYTAKMEDGTLSSLQVTSGNSDFWTYSNAAMHWEIDGVWKVPISNMSYMAPLYGNYYKTDGKDGVKPPPPMQDLIDWYSAMRATPNENERLKLGRNILKQWSDECYVIGICRPPVVTIVSDRLKNVPDVINYDYRLKSPGYLNPEQFFIDENGKAAQ